MEFELDIPFFFITHDQISFSLRFQTLMSNVFLQKKRKNVLIEIGFLKKNLFFSLLDVPSINLIK